MQGSEPPAAHAILSLRGTHSTFSSTPKSVFNPQLLTEVFFFSSTLPSPLVLWSTTCSFHLNVLRTSLAQGLTWRCVPVGTRLGCLESPKVEGRLWGRKAALIRGVQDIPGNIEVRRPSTHNWETDSLTLLGQIKNPFCWLSIFQRYCFFRRLLKNFEKLFQPSAWLCVIHSSFQRNIGHLRRVSLRRVNPRAFARPGFYLLREMNKRLSRSYDLLAEKKDSFNVFFCAMMMRWEGDVVTLSTCVMRNLGCCVVE